MPRSRHGRRSASPRPFPTRSALVRVAAACAAALAPAGAAPAGAAPAGAATAGAAPPWGRWPIARPVAEHFQRPATRYGPGNRGLDFASRPGDPVRAVHDGVVGWVGRIAGEWYVTIVHPGGLRSTSSYLATVAVAVGQPVTRGRVIGTAGGRPFHLGVLRGDAYLDPEPMLGPSGRSGHAVLVVGTR